MIFTPWTFTVLPTNHTNFETITIFLHALVFGALTSFVGNLFLKCRWVFLFDSLPDFIDLCLVADDVFASNTLTLFSTNSTPLEALAVELKAMRVFAMTFSNACLFLSFSFPVFLNSLFLEFRGDWLKTGSFGRKYTLLFLQFKSNIGSSFIFQLIFPLVWITLFKVFSLYFMGKL